MFIWPHPQIKLQTERQTARCQTTTCGGPLSYGRIEHFGDGVRKASRARTYRAPDLMVTMLAAGIIDLDMAQAGRAFRSNFYTAGYVDLRALDPGKVPGGRGPGNPSEAAVDARTWILSVGSLARLSLRLLKSPLKSCHVARDPALVVMRRLLPSSLP